MLSYFEILAFEWKAEIPPVFVHSLIPVVMSEMIVKTKEMKNILF